MKALNKHDPTTLITSLQQFHELTPGIVRYFEQKTETFRCARGEKLLNAGEVCNYIYFIQQGVVRGFILDGEKDITTWITAENELVTSIYSLDQQAPALENMETVEDCILVAMKSKDLQQLYETFPEFNVTGRKLLQQYYRDAERRAYIIRHSNATTKYELFLAHYPHLSNRIPLKYVASFLGIAFETLSRVRKKLAITT